MSYNIVSGTPDERPQLSTFIRTRIISILVNQNEGEFKENLNFQNAVSLQLVDTGR
jgi:hypothetical protein